MKLSRIILAAGASLTLVTQPLAAQEAAPAEDDAAIFEALQGMFAVEPLTSEQEARLPLAGTIVRKMIPEGTLGEMMGSMFDKMLGPIMEISDRNPKGEVAERLRVPAAELDITEEQAVELADLLDPVRKERNAAIARVMPELMTSMMTTMEPTVRKAMTELYAIHFTGPELTEIDAFFSTPTGASFARKSFSMSSDPRIIGASMEALPAMMGAFAEMEDKMLAATAHLPAAREWDDLDAAQRARIAELTGIDEATLEENLSAVAIGADAEEMSAEENGQD